VAAWVLSFASGPLACDASELGRLVARVEAGTLTAAAGKQVLAKLAAEGGSVDVWVTTLDLAPITDEALLGGIVDEVLAASPDLVARYRAGNAGVLGALVGALMKRTGGRAHGPTLQALLAQRLG
jgi:Asp-tRNA(Asn)/Glu-tRNA(Gln) amidotransferase B subunit